MSQGSVFEWKIPVSDCLPIREHLAARFKDRGGMSLSPEIDPLYPLLNARVQPRGGFAVFPVFCDNESVVIKDSVFLTGSIIAAAFKGATHAAIFSATIGSAVEAMGEKFIKQGDMLKGYFTDAYGSESAERAAEFIHEQVREFTRGKSWGCGNRYSPGYCGWDVSAQNDLFYLLPPNFCGISLTDSSMMLPVKSVSGIIPVGFGITHKPYACGTCTRTGCARKGG